MMRPIPELVSDALPSISFHPTIWPMYGSMF